MVRVLVSDDEGYGLGPDAMMTVELHELHEHARSGARGEGERVKAHGQWVTSMKPLPLTVVIGTEEPARSSFPRRRLT
jgi:hypothetical protein